VKKEKALINKGKWGRNSEYEGGDRIKGEKKGCMLRGRARLKEMGNQEEQKSQNTLYDWS